MQKKVLAVAVAGALTVPVIASAQTSVTISGQVKASVINTRYGSPLATRGNTVENRMTDDGSNLVFGIREDLGGGLAAIGQLSFTKTVDQQEYVTDIRQNTPSGDQFVGLQSTTFGMIRFGMLAAHGGLNGDFATAKHTLGVSSAAILNYTVTAAAGTGTAIATGRHQNVVRWDSPNWNGFTAGAMWSSARNGQEGDLAPISAASTVANVATAQRRGNMVGLNAQYAASNWRVGYSYYRDKPDGPTYTAASLTQGVTATTATGPTFTPMGGAAAVAATSTSINDSKSQKLYVSAGPFAGFSIGLTWDKSQVNRSIGGASVSNRTAWGLPFKWESGPHEISGAIARMGNDKSALLTGLDTKSSMWAIGYAYSLSKRTSAGISYASLKNGANSAQHLSGDSTAANTGYNSSNSQSGAGEDPRKWAFTLRHTF